MAENPQQPGKQGQAEVSSEDGKKGFNARKYSLIALPFVALILVLWALWMLFQPSAIKTSEALELLFVNGLIV